MQETRTLEVFFISDRTGITAESFGRSLMTQFAEDRIHYNTLPYIDTEEKMSAVINRVDSAVKSGRRVIAFSTISNAKLRQRLGACDFFVLDLFSACLPALQTALDLKSSPAIGQTHGMGNQSRYMARMDAVNFTLNVDDGLRTRDYEEADIILAGVSRSGKTPTCLYLAMQFGIRAANYPLLGDELENGSLPVALKTWKSRVFGLQIDPLTLQRIRQARRPDSTYASAEQCRREVRLIDAMFKQEGIPVIESSSMSVEELATTLMQKAGLHRQF